MNIRKVRKKVERGKEEVGRRREEDEQRASWICKDLGSNSA